MRPLRVLIVDDSPLFRQAPQATVNDPNLRVVAAVGSGAQALDLLCHQAVDVAVLDVELPGMDGLQLLRELRRRYPTLRMIMLSPNAQRGAKITIDALLAGAADCIPKPAQAGSPEEALARLRDALVPRLTGVGTPAPAAAPRAPVATSPAEPARLPRARGAIRPPASLVVIGASTGGPAALATVLGHLRAPAPVPVLIVQHMPAEHTAALAQSLRATGHDVAEARDGEAVGPGQVRLARGGKHLLVTRVRSQLITRLDDGPEEQFCRPAVDPLFRSAALAAGPDVVGCVLTGMGSDGAAGAARIVAGGGAVIAQDEATSVVWGMAGAVARAGLAEAVLPLSELGGELGRRLLATSGLGRRVV